MKAYFLQRMIAYFIDVLIIGLVSVLFTFWIPISKNYDAALQNLKTTTEQYINNEISEDVFLDLSNEYNYIMQKALPNTVGGSPFSLGGLLSSNLNERRDS